MIFGWGSSLAPCCNGCSWASFTWARARLTESFRLLAWERLWRKWDPVGNWQIKWGYCWTHKIWFKPQNQKHVDLGLSWVTPLWTSSTNCSKKGSSEWVLACRLWPAWGHWLHQQLFGEECNPVLKLIFASSLFAKAVDLVQLRSFPLECAMVWQARYDEFIMPPLCSASLQNSMGHPPQILNQKLPGVTTLIQPPKNGNIQAALQLYTQYGGKLWPLSQVFGPQSTTLNNLKHFTAILGTFGWPWKIGLARRQKKEIRWGKSRNLSPAPRGYLSQMLASCTFINLHPEAQKASNTRLKAIFT